VGLHAQRKCFRPEAENGGRDARAPQTQLHGSGLDAIKSSPTGAGHFLHVGSRVVSELRRRNLKSFPFFVLYGFTGDQLLFGSIIPSRSDPLTWLSRFQDE
jgi:hypothetical protein